MTLAEQAVKNHDNGFNCSQSVCAAFAERVGADGFTAGSPEAKSEMYARVQTLIEKFTARHDTLICQELLGYNIGIPEELEQIKQQQLFATRCSAFIGSTTQILEEMGC